MPPRHPRIESFNLRPGRRIGHNYQVVDLLGKGVEGEVYSIQETDTGIQRAAKLYFPHRDPKHRSSIWHARKLNALRNCPIVLQYHHTEVARISRQKIVCLISDLAEGVQLERWIRHHRAGKVPLYVALHVLYQLVRGLEAVHALGEYHADVHSQNILIKPRGIAFDIRLVDFYDWGKPARFKQQQDIYDTIQVFIELVGGKATISRQRPETRHLCGAGRWDLILKRFPTMTALRRHLETFEWTSDV